MAAGHSVALGVGVSSLASGFLLMGEVELGPVVAGGVLFIGGALASGWGVLGSSPARRGLLAKASLGFGLAGLALSALMAGVSPFTGQRSQTLGLVTGAVGAAAGLILIGAGGLALRRASAEGD